MKHIKIKMFCNEEIGEALSLVWRVFLQFEAPDYGEEGVSSFRRSVWNPEYLRQLTFFGAHHEETLVGVLATREGLRHITLFFVDAAYQRSGVGKALFQKACSENDAGICTVHAAPYAVPIYHRLGFCDTGKMQQQDGISYTPMRCDCSRVWLNTLLSPDSVTACAACNRLLARSEEAPGCADLFSAFPALLDHKSSLVRNRALTLLAANAKWVSANQFAAVLPSILTHITDEKPITARQCIHSLPLIAACHPSLRGDILAALQAADFSVYADSMRPLLEADRTTALQKIKTEEEFS